MIGLNLVQHSMTGILNKFVQFLRMRVPTNLIVGIVEATAECVRKRKSDKSTFMSDATGESCDSSFNKNFHIVFSRFGA